ncbi:uncharacterized protein C8A04DRAFT_25510 [Dichotomopilus funicola]|uniref:Uncharacterized protein n=1 Tax=Dichotomopilus funicola TaxID=1934379 RepID=A0AAN6V883_9PEZI|nr:hypothetical protein C8A04DRAFT_25510 [Dichotomopilus funicola]
MSETNVGAIISLTAPEEGDTIWKATQTEVQHNLPPGDAPGHVGIDWGFGPIKVSGYIDTDTYGIGVSVSVVGIHLGNIYGNLKDGVGLSVDLFVVSGAIKFYLKNGNELWIHLDLKIKFNGHYDGDYKILAF